MKRFTALATALALSLGAAACGGNDGDEKNVSGADSEKPSLAESTKGGPEAGKLVFAHSAVPQIVKLPQTLALEQLEQQGYEVDQQYLQTTTDSINAVLRGSATIGNTAPANFFAAVAGGADLVAIAGGGRPDYVFVGRQAVDSVCGNAKRLAINNPISTTDVLVRLEAAKCPNGGKDKEILTVALTPNRIKALLADQIDATPVQLTTDPLIKRQYQGKLKVLSNAAEDYPTTINTITFVKRSTLEQRPKAILDFLAAQKQVIEQAYADPSIFVKATKRLIDSVPAPDVEPSVKLYLDSEVFPRDGGLAPKLVRDTYQQLRDTGLLKKDLDPEEYVDRRFLETIYGSGGDARNGT